MTLKDTLKKIVKGEIIDDSESLEPYSKDASIFQLTPQLVVCPKDKEDLIALAKFSSENPEISLTPRSAGTDMSGGAINEGILVDMTKHFNQILEIGESFAKVQPGLFYRDLEAETLKTNQILPCFTASKDLCTVGGMVANNSAGERTLSAGQTKDYVKSLKVILSDGSEIETKPLTKPELEKKLKHKDLEGQIYNQVWNLIQENQQLIEDKKPKTHKNSTGYLIWEVWDEKIFDLSKLIVGSQGTLGIITEIEFKLVPNNPHKTLLVIELKSLDYLDEVINDVLQFNPMAFECYDDQTIQYSLKFLSELQTHFRFNSPSEVKKTFFHEKVQKFFKKLPKLVLLAQFSTPELAQAIDQAVQAQDALKKYKLDTKVLVNDKVSEKYWVTRHESFNMLRHHADHMRTAPFIDDIIVRPEYLPKFLPELEQILLEYNLMYTIAGHIGDGNFHIIPLMDFKDPLHRETILELNQRVFELVFKYQGSMSAEHNDGLVRGPYLQQMYGEQMYQIFKKIKEIFDSKGILNPHKKVDATFDYSYNHLAKN